MHINFEMAQIQWCKVENHKIQLNNTQLPQISETIFGSSCQHVKKTLFKGVNELIEMLCGFVMLARMLVTIHNPIYYNFEPYHP